MKKIIFISGFAIIILVLIILKTVSCRSERQIEKKSGTTTSIPADGWVVRDTIINYRISTIGTIRPNESVDIVSEINKKLAGIYMKEGDMVSQGQLLFKLDDADITARINKVTVEEELAALNEQRQYALLGKGGISQESYDQVSYQLKTIRAELEILKVEWDKTEIRAPFSGKIGLRNVSTGSWITPEVTLTNLQDIHQLKLDFSLPERYASDINPGAQISFSVESRPELFSAVVDACEPAVDPRTRTLLVRAIADNRQQHLVPGESIKVFIELQKLTKSIFIPSTALVPSPQGYSVFVCRKSFAQSIPVNTGIRTEDFVQVLEGLRYGDTVITTNLLRIKKDSRVTIDNLNPR